MVSTPLNVERSEVKAQPYGPVAWVHLQDVLVEIKVLSQLLGNIPVHLQHGLVAHTYL